MSEMVAKARETRKDMTSEGLVDDDLKGFVSGADTLIGGELNEAYGKGTASKLRPLGEAQSIPKPCDEQFSGRLVVSSCAVSVAVGDLFGVRIAIKSFEAAPNDDRAMRGCLAAKGEWRELPKDSRDLQRERLQQRYRALVGQ